MKKLVCCLAVALTVACASTSRVIENDIKVAEVNGSGQSTISDVRVYLNNEGSERASVRFETTYKSDPKRVHRLYIFDEDVPELKIALNKAVNDQLSVDDLFKPLNFGRDKGVVGQLKTETAEYVKINTIEGAYIFPESSIPSVLKILTELQESGKVKN